MKVEPCPAEVEHEETWLTHSGHKTRRHWQIERRKILNLMLVSVFEMLASPPTIKPDIQVIKGKGEKWRGNIEEEEKGNEDRIPMRREALASGRK